MWDADLVLDGNLHLEFLSNRASDPPPCRRNGLMLLPRRAMMLGIPCDAASNAIPARLAPLPSRTRNGADEGRPATDRHSDVDGVELDGVTGASARLGVQLEPRAGECRRGRRRLGARC